MSIRAYTETERNFSDSLPDSTDAKEYTMNIDKNLLDKLAAMDDDSLAASIRAIAAASGIDLAGVSFDK